MTEIFIPIITNNSNPSPTPGTTHLVIDPITRIEGHLRIELSINNGVITDAWAASTMFRGIEPILIGRDPRDAAGYTQRICGVCTSNHAVASVQAVENALGITIPENARLLRNLMEAAQMVQDHVIHFYHLHALDWVDIVSALSADPTATSNLQKSISTWGNNSPTYFSTVRSKLQTFVDSGQLGLFANGYWGHPAYKLPPEGNLLAAAHYLEALDWQRDFIKFHAYIGGKNPHPQTYVVGGMAVPLDPSNNNALNPTKIAALKTLVAQALDFVTRVYIPDLLLVASFYKDWANTGTGVGNYLAYGDFPTDTSGNPANLFLPRGIVLNKNIAAAPMALDQNLIKEYISRSWYTYSTGDLVPRHPTVGETVPNYTGPTPPYQRLTTDAKYSWLKAPRYDDQPMEVGPLARMLVAYANGHSRVVEMVSLVLNNLQLTPDQLFSNSWPGCRPWYRNPDRSRTNDRVVGSTAGQYQRWRPLRPRRRKMESFHLAGGRLRLGRGRGSAWRPGALGTHPEWQDCQLPGRRSHHLEWIAPGCAGPAWRL